MQAVFVISVAAELAGVHPQTLRIYERKGLVEPARTETTYYRAVYTDPRTGIPYAKLLRDSPAAPAPGE